MHFQLALPVAAERHWDRIRQQLTKVLLQMKHGMLAPSLLHSERTNSNINFLNSPFYVQRELKKWECPTINKTTYPRRAGISSFGAGGLNVHLIVEEYNNGVKKPINKDISSEPVIVTLSDISYTLSLA